MSLITINEKQMPIVEYRGQRVVTFAMVDLVHERPDGTARRNFNANRDRFIEGKHLFKICADEFRSRFPGIISDRVTEDVTLLTERGYLLLVKSFTDDLAWTVQDQLVDGYFAKQTPPALPGDYISALEHLLESKRSEQLAIEQRDHAIATKAEIGSRREATAMASASAAVREARRLADELGRGTRQATVKAIENITGTQFDPQGWRKLRAWCDDHGVQPNYVEDPLYGRVRAWPAEAWKEVYDIDLNGLFGHHQHRITEGGASSACP
ncbi:ORF6N domain-containing protein [Pseudomonas aeruginosa]|uniref:ORF6N domain-containing protein n=1 Tax=Pseudomonas aeruginosa TaxID=287 RepID=UPI0022DDF62E|nr:ORF6N domain-containing protein [Pseudomonas aeruginosa]WBM15774.1 ORF6N domain-containing protein [Pseudomonas aeruginosa]